MEQVTLNVNPKLTHAIARNIAENVWGRGGTHYSKCNLSGAYYFSCSSHGGYVVEKSFLLPSEIAEVEKYIKPCKLWFLVQNGKILNVDYSSFSDSKRRRSFKVNPLLPFVWEELEIYLFEEDCAWAVLEAFTSFKTVSSNEKEDRKKIAFETLNFWFCGPKKLAI